MPLIQNCGDDGQNIPASFGNGKNTPTPGVGNSGGDMGNSNNEPECWQY